MDPIVSACFIAPCLTSWSSPRLLSPPLYCSAIGSLLRGGTSSQSQWSSSPVGHEEGSMLWPWWRWRIRRRRGTYENNKQYYGGSQPSLSASSPSSVAAVGYSCLLMNLEILKQNASLALRELQCLYCATLVPVHSITLDLACSM
ncbi:hypothetical protein PVAP13_2NG043119 [Panicum virgatum]|uniref:Uncharacterized protein n=1 Tax=Panicum virgatum TaxID=38727 RepID=A0A8T0VEJ7_PANVG|nr:hypothetical protein PVAP13_2NG043119 [Panicum virgatum]